MVLMSLPVSEKYICFTMTHLTRKKKIIFITILITSIYHSAAVLYFRHVSHWLRLLYFMIICHSYLLLKCIVIKNLKFKIIGRFVIFKI